MLLAPACSLLLLQLVTFFGYAAAALTALAEINVEIELRSDKQLLQFSQVL